MKSFFRRIDIDLEAERKRIKFKVRGYTLSERKKLLKVVDFVELEDLQGALTYIKNEFTKDEKEYIGLEIGDLLMDCGMYEIYGQQQLLAQARITISEQDEE